MSQFYPSHTVIFIVDLSKNYGKVRKSLIREVTRHTYTYLKGLTPKEIKAELDDVHGTSAFVFDLFTIG